MKTVVGTLIGLVTEVGTAVSIFVGVFLVGTVGTASICPVVGTAVSILSGRFSC